MQHAPSPIGSDPHEVEPTAHWWQRPVSTRGLTWALLGTAGLWTACVAAGLAWAYERIEFRTNLSDQTLKMHLPDHMMASADLHSRIATAFKSNVALHVPIAQQVQVSLPPYVEGESRIAVDVPVDTVISHDFQLPIETTVDTTVQVAAWLPDIRVRFPVRMTLPVAMKVPVQAKVPLTLALQTKARVPTSVSVPIKTDVRVQVPIQQELEIESTSRAYFALRPNGDGIAVKLVKADMSMPMADLQLRPLSASSHTANQGQQGQQQHPQHD